MRAQLSPTSLLLTWFVAACAGTTVPSGVPSPGSALSAPTAPTPETAGPSNSSALPADGEVQGILAERIGELGDHYGIVVGLVDTNGPRIVSRGRFDKQEERALDRNTLFELGSISEVFTSLLLQVSVERAEVRLDDPIGKHLPAGTKTPSFTGHPITLRHLATHTSGLPRVPTNLDAKDSNDPYADYTVEKLYEFLASFELKREPGSEYDYSNLGAAVLARAPSTLAARALRGHSTGVTPGSQANSRRFPPGSRISM
jgi:CubicO group peptidase (beta-lactamase class C family)